MKEPRFTMDDFEKGLMLLGHLTPKDEKEAAEKLALDVYERYKLKVGDKTQYGTIKYIDMRIVIYEDRPDFCFLLSGYTAFPTTK